MIRFILMLAFLLLNQCQAVFAQESQISKKQMLQDIDGLVKMINYSHPNPYYYRSKEEWGHYLDSLKNKLPENLSMFDFWRQIDKILAFMNDAHTRSYPTQFYKKYVNDGGLFFPFSIENKKGNYFLKKNYSDQKEIDAVKEITAINGIPIKEIVKTLKLQSSKELDFLDEKYVTESFPYYLWRVYDWKSPYQIDFLDKEGKAGQLEAQGILSTMLAEKKPEAKEETCKLEILNDSVALLTIKDFDSESRSYFRKFYKKSFRKMNQLQIQNIIIDIRNHDGGDTRYGEDLGMYFADKPFRSSSKTLWKVTPEFKKNFAALYIPKIMRWAKFTYGMNKHTKAIWNTKDNELAVVEHKLIKPKKTSLKHKKKVYVLIDNYTFSAGSMFAAMVKDYQLGTLVGQPTANLSSFYADPIMWYALPNSKFTFQVSTSLDVRPNGIIDTESILPDITVDDDQDALQKTLELIENTK